jgi:hypothetical protein
MDDLSLDMSHELELVLDQSRRAKLTGSLRQEGMMPDETGNMGKRKRPMRGLRTKAKKRDTYDY